jgi:photosystem II stability/assembly factor-like uncharacterized protein
MQQKTNTLMGCLFALCVCNTPISAQQDSKTRYTRPAAEHSAATTAPKLEPWLQKPYLQTPVETATVQELMVAAQLWRQQNQPQSLKLKDDDFAKFQRKIYQWQREGAEKPATAHERMDAFSKYEHSQETKSRRRAYQVDPNWKLLGPKSNPVEVPYHEVGYADESRDNAGLGRINCIEFSNWDANNLWVGTSTGGVWKSWDGGRQWYNISMTLPIMEISDIAIDQNNSNIIYVATGDRDLGILGGGWYGNGIGSRLYKTTDGGNSWSQINTNFGPGTFIWGLYTHPTRSDEVVVVKANGVYKSADGGATWKEPLIINHQTEFYLANAAVSPADPNRMYVLTLEEFPARHYTCWLNRSDDFGNTWRRMDSMRTGINEPLFFSTDMKLSIAPSDANCVYWMSLEFDTLHNSNRFGILTRTLDGGRTWQDRARYPSVPNLSGWALGGETDLGSQGAYDMVLAIDPKNKDRVFVSGVDMWGSENGGNTFSKTTFWLDALGKSAHADHHWGEFQPKTGTFFLATDGGLYKTKQLKVGNQTAIANCYSATAYNIFNLNCYEFPTQWEYAGNGIANNEFYAIEVSKSNPDFILGGTQDNGTFKYQNGKWTSVLGGDGFVPLIHPTNPNTYYGSVYFGILFRTYDGGRNYKYVTRAMDTVDGGAWLTPMALVEAAPNTILQARDKHVWRTTNAGETWQPISNFPQGRLFSRSIALATAPSDGNTIWTARWIMDQFLNVAPPTSFLFKTTNGGTAWTNVWSPQFPTFPSEVTDIEIHPTQPNKIWVTFSAGYVAANPNQAKKVFYSADAGATWVNLTAGLPPVPVWTIAVSAESYDDAIYVGTGVGVFYRDNRTNGFIEYQNQQMPKGTIVTDLKIHAGSRRIYAGTHGHGIWQANLYDNPKYVHALSKKAEPSYFLSVYPNPSAGLMDVVWEDDKMPVESLQISDVMGKIVYQTTDFNGKLLVDMTTFASGIYMVHLKTAESVVTKKILIEK